MSRTANLSFDLLETFVRLIELEGSAAKTIELLGITQPSMSKRLRNLQHAGALLKHPWLVRVGKTWKLTDEGRKVLPAVRDLVARYEHLTSFVEEPGPGGPHVRFACGREAATGFVQRAVRTLCGQRPGLRLRISTLRGAARIEGVANGSLDLATVAHDDAEIQEKARRTLHIEPLVTDRLALVCGAKTPWAAALGKLPEQKAPAKALAEFPLIVPEPDAGVRHSLDKTLRAQGLLHKLDIRMEIGGWSTIMSYVRLGLGVGVVSEAAIAAGSSLVVRFLDALKVPVFRTKLICRRLPDAHSELDLTPDARLFYEQLKLAAAAR